MIEVDNRIWWSYLEPGMKELMMQSVLLLEKTKSWKSEFNDYSFIVFPAAKAYEGFLKTLFLDLGFITKDEFTGKKFRIGKALNPTLYTHAMKKHVRYKKLRSEMSVYDKLIEYCDGVDLADNLWNTWKECRNILFHWFPNETNSISRDEAGAKIRMIMDSMDVVFKECKLDRRK